MSFGSILFLNAADRIPEDRAVAPDCFPDLNLDQIVAAVTAGKEEYRLAPFFHTPLRDVDAVTFRHEVMRDLDSAQLSDAIDAFAGSMHTIREHLAQLEGRFYDRQKERWFLDAVDIYGDAAKRLAHDLAIMKFTSRGLVGFRDYLTGYISSERFRSLIEEATALKAAISAIRYKISIRGAHVGVFPYAGEGDYSAEIDETFARFQQGDVGAYKFRFSDALEMNHVEARILDGIAHLHPDLFSRLTTYRSANADFQDATLAAFDREIQFYVAYRDHTAKFKAAGLKFCYPRVSDARKEFRDDCGFDLALAGKLIGAGRLPVTNDFCLNGQERILVVSGPNQGGKTTAARTFGQLHYLGSLGLPVPGSEAVLYLPDRIFTHFEREEQVSNLRGKLQDDLIRVHDILAAATPQSVVVINEIFASTTLRDAIFLSRRIGARIIDLDLLCVWVTFIDEVATLGPQTVSMVATVVADNPAQRTFKVVRRPADGLAHALALAEKYRLTYDMIKERVGS